MCTRRKRLSGKIVKTAPTANYARYLNIILLSKRKMVFGADGRRNKYNGKGKKLTGENK